MKVVWILGLGCLAISCCLAAPGPPLPEEIQLTPEAEKLLAELVEIAGDHDPDDSDRNKRTSKYFDSKKFSLGSISSFHHEDKYNYKHELEQKAFNLWGLKKAIFASLLQAIKAITGGVIAVKGHLIKGGGKIVEATGKVLEHKGAAVTEFGKHVAYKALSKPISLPDYSGYGHYHHQHGHGGYGVPPVNHNEHVHFYHHTHHVDPPHHGGYEYPHFHAKSGAATEPSEQKDKKALPDGMQAGLIVLKPIKNEGASLSAPSAPASGGYKDQGFYKYSSTGQKDDGYYRFDPIGEYSEPTAAALAQPTPSAESFFSQSVPQYYDKSSISRSIDYTYYVPQY